MGLCIPSSNLNWENELKHSFILVLISSNEFVSYLCCVFLLYLYLYGIQIYTYMKCCENFMSIRQLLSNISSKYKHVLLSSEAVTIEFLDVWPRHCFSMLVFSFSQNTHALNTDLNRHIYMIIKFDELFKQINRVLQKR